MEEINNIILTDLKTFISENDIKIVSNSDWQSIGTKLVFKKDINTTLVCYYYMDTKADNMIFFEGFNYYLIYNKLEEIVSKILIASEIVGRNYDILDRPSFKNEKAMVYSYKELKVDNICKLSEIFLDSFSTYYLPFFNKWNSLNVLYEYIKYKEGREELHPILGQFWQFKKATILRLCNDENYQDYMDAFYNREKQYFEEDPEDIDNIRYYNAAKQLKEVLDKTVPIYNV